MPAIAELPQRVAAVLEVRLLPCLSDVAGLR